MLSKIVLFILSLFVISCGNDKTKIVLREDSVMLKNPEKAYRMLLDDSAKVQQQNTATRMYYQILLCRTKDLCYIPHESDSVMLGVLKYYQQHHDSENMAKANYCLGCIYRDMHEVPLAIEYFRKSLVLLDKEGVNELEARCCSQLAQLEDQNMNGAAAIRLYNRALRCFKKVKDAKGFFSTMLNLGSAYHFMGNEDKAIACIECAEKNAMVMGDSSTLANAFVTEALMATDAEDYGQLERILKQAKGYLGNRHLEQRGFYMAEGYLNKHKGNMDEAAAFFKKVIQLDGREDCYRGRYEAYMNLKDICKYKKNYPQAISYGELADMARDSIDLETNIKQVKQMDAAYSYNRSLRKSNELEKETEQLKFTVAIIVLVFLFAIIGWMFFLVYVYKRKMIYERIIYEKERVKMRAAVGCGQEEWDALRNSQPYMLLHHIIEDKNTDNRYEDIMDMIAQLKKTIDDLFDNFGGRWRSIYPKINVTQMNVCYLIKADFKPTEIATLLSMTRAAITNAKARIAKNCLMDEEEKQNMDEFIRKF